MWNTGFSFRQLTFNSIRIKGSWFLLDTRKNSVYCEGGDAVEQRNCECPIPGQGHVGWGSEQ